jgi:hypothetical protein
MDRAKAANRRTAVFLRTETTKDLVSRPATGRESRSFASLGTKKSCDYFGADGAGDGVGGSLMISGSGLVTDWVAPVGMTVTV